MIVLTACLLKRKFQDKKSDTSLDSMIRQKRMEIAFCLDDSPSLNLFLADNKFLRQIWDMAVIKATDATQENGIPEKGLPVSPIWAVELILDKNFFPSPAFGSNK